MIDKRKVRVDIGFWNTHGIYIPDIQEVSEVEMYEFDEDDLANREYDRLKDDGYKSYQDKIWQESYKRAAMDYERRLNNPYDYM